MLNEPSWMNMEKRETRKKQNRTQGKRRRGKKEREEKRVKSWLGPEESIRLETGGKRKLEEERGETRADLDLRKVSGQRQEERES
jgi:hypothetical protein